VSKKGLKFEEIKGIEIKRLKAKQPLKNSSLK
jgi:hypothetical protein